jgi:hypothetical protein
MSVNEFVSAFLLTATDRNFTLSENEHLVCVDEHISASSPLRTA